MDFEKLGRTIFEAITGKKEESQVDSTSTDVGTNPVNDQIENKEDTDHKTGKETEVDARDIRIKELEELLIQKDNIIVQNQEQITALKELTSVDNPVNGLEELSLEEIIKRGEF